MNKMRKLYRKLTADQIKRGVIFSSQLTVYNDCESVRDASIHEVLESSTDKDRQITLLQDDSFFKSSQWNFNIIRN